MKRVLITTAVLAASTAGWAQPAGKQPEAVALLNEVIAAHGGDKPAQLRLAYRGGNRNPEQSLRAEGPFEPYQQTVRIALDEQAGALAAELGSSISGDFGFNTRFAFAGGKGFALDAATNQYDELPILPPVADIYVPHRLLKQILASASTLALAAGDGEAQRLTYSIGQGAPRTLVIDGKTKLLQAVLRPPMPSAHGDRTTDTLYGSYRRVAGVAVPGSVTMRNKTAVHGKLDTVLTLSETKASAPTAAELAMPAGAVKRDTSWRPDFSAKQLGENVYLLQNVTGTRGQWSYNVLAVVFDDHVLVAEAPIDSATSEKVIAKIAEIAPGKPVRTLVQSHHHGDHLGGIRPYIANGTKIMAPAGAEGVIRRIAEAHSQVATDALAKAPRAPVVETVTGDRTIKDATNEVRIFALSNPHAERMLVVYLPKQKLLYQADFVNAGEYPLNATSRSFLRWLKGKELDIETMAGFHGQVLDAAQVRTLLVEQRLAAG